MRKKQNLNNFSAKSKPNQFELFLLGTGQQLIQLPDGKLHVTSYVNHAASPRAVHLGKNTIMANNNNFTKSGSPVSSKDFINELNVQFIN